LACYFAEIDILDIGDNFELIALRSKARVEAPGLNPVK
jgi:hypothetical protein